MPAARQPTAEVVVRPTLKYIRIGYAITLLIIAGAVAAWAIFLSQQQPWVLIAPVLLLLIPLNHHIQRQATRTTMTGDRLRYETGMLSKTTRTIQLSKVQDVRVDQTLRQRIFGIGDISIETAGETSRLTLRNVDSPQQIADQILAAAQKGQGPAV